MTEADTMWWADFWSHVEHWAFLAVVIALAVEFAAIKFASPYKETLEKARQLQIAQLTDRSAAAELELAKLKKPRALSPEQQKRVAFPMNRFGGISFNVSVSNTKEAINLLGQIEGALASAGLVQVDWPTETAFIREGKPRVGFTTESGVAIQVDDADTGPLQPIAKILASALRAEGIEAEWTPMTTSPHQMGRQTLHVVIGQKPE